MQLAAEIGITPTTVYRYEAATNTPTNDLLAKLLQLAIKKQSLSTVQRLAAILSARTGLRVGEGEAQRVSPAFVKAIGQLQLERRVLIMAAIVMLQEGTDSTALRVFEHLVSPWIEKASEIFGPMDIIFYPHVNEAPDSQPK